MKHFIRSLILIALILTLITGFKSDNKGATDLEKITFFNIGHRGTRGLMPENTIPAFEKGIEVGANTIEFDIHVTKDGQVMIYHDNSFTPAYTTKPDGSEISDEERKNYTFYQMDYSDIRKFIIGEKYYKAFPEQHLQKTYAPLLSEMIDSIELFTKANNYPPVVYLLEIKSDPKTDGFEQPAPAEYMEKMMNVLKPYLQKIEKRLIIQSFDPRPLKILHRDYPDIPIGILVGDKNRSMEEYLKELGFIPEFYNPHFSFVTKEFMKDCKERKMRVLPWTVEKKEDMKRMIDLGVDGIISDYPNRTTELLDSLNQEQMN